jgi:hypothetical protein
LLDGGGVDEPPPPPQAARAAAARMEEVARLKRVNLLFMDMPLLCKFVLPAVFASAVVELYIPEGNISVRIHT